MVQICTTVLLTRAARPRLGFREPCCHLAGATRLAAADTWVRYEM